jgi:predicted secreted Zn-dependent protease
MIRSSTRIILACAFWACIFWPVIGDDLPPWFAIKNAKLVKYNISGSTTEQLRNEMNRKGPHGYHGYTEWNFNWNCKEIKATCTVTLPYWESGESTPELQKKYREYWNKLARHEQGHVDIVTKNLDATKKLTEKMDCIHANLAWARMLQLINSESSKYDSNTDHGKKQGAVF